VWLFLQQTYYFSCHYNYLRKIAAIFLLLIFLFNLFGYQLLIGILSHKADKKLEALIDYKAYNEEDLLEIKVSLNMPYQQRYTDYERHYGQITINKTIYTYVKRKIEGDVLILKCLPNISKTQLKEAANDFTAANTGTYPTDNKNVPAKGAIKKVAFDYESETFFLATLTKNIHDIKYSSFYHAAIPTVTQPVLIQPPSQFFA
jgi:hypothetical protein